jgi:hypothetical protein
VSHYAFRVRGRLSPQVVAALEPLSPSSSATETVLLGVLADQAALHHVIARLDQLGVELVELRRLPAQRTARGPSRHAPAAPFEA